MNRLGSEKSPYLLQHAANPVDWYAWGDEAFLAAKAQNKPVFLSLGYSTCHWYHVMAHECFENPAIAERMNRTFINVKVDREERPDIDAVYMTVCQAITGSGGWPLTIIMTPDRKPFFAGTYFPPESRHGRIGMPELIDRIDDLWTNRKQDLLKSADNVTQLLRSYSPSTAGALSEISLLSASFDELTADYDPVHGGFGDAPKFPTPQKLIYLLRCWKRFNDDQALQMVEKTLQGMRHGGIYDHVGFGFHRYATDATWLLPHFEKMLYDQAMIAVACLETYQATRRDQYARTASEIFTYVLRDLQSPQGAFYSAQDADSEGEEGRFYVWTQNDVEKILTPQEAVIWNRVYSVEAGGNFIDEAKRQKTGANIFHLKTPLEEWATQLKMSPHGLGALLEKCRNKLYRAREKRIHPFRDDKILTDWNGLMIASLAFGARVLNDNQYEIAARAAADFILSTLRDEKGNLLHCFRNHEAAIPAFLDDHAFLIWGLIELYQSGFDVKYLEAAIELNDHLLQRFWDDRDGGFFFTSSDHEELLFRKKSIHDGAIPSGNSVSAINLVRLARLTGNTQLEQKAERIGGAFAGLIRQSPSAVAFYLTALDYLMGPSHEIVIAAEQDSRAVKAINQALSGRFVPNKVVMLVPDGSPAAAIKKIAPFTESFKGEKGKAAIYVCTDRSCQKPTTDIAEMIGLLNDD
ncbi:MAG: thioredoxin domain-containing protein [Syntrophus sp. (in: bacteria)]|nr:thioredoxin domain-containing protein [Syntrophus sp. (in: bacteria)]